MNVIFALFPNARGLCYVCLEMPTNLIDYGIINPLPFCQGRFTKRVERILAFFQPTVVVLRSLETDFAQNKKAKQLIVAITKLATEKGLPVHYYTRRQIRDVFEVHDAYSKHEIAQKIISWIPDLAPHAPVVRKLWLPEDHRMGIFDATALALTHDYLKK